MNTRRITSRIVLLVVAALALPARASAAEVPFNGTLDGTVVVTPVAPPVFDVDVEATGTANQLGHFTASVPHTVDRSVGRATGTYAFTAANGDTLTAEFEGRSVPTAVPGVLYIVETARITGGTGRFAGATGHFVVERLFNAPAGVTSGSFRGAVTSPGESKK